MTATLISRFRIDWRLPLAFVLGGIAIFCALVTYSLHFGDFLYLLLVVPFVGLFLLLSALLLKGRRLSFAVTLSAFLAVSAFLLTQWQDIRSDGRWLLHSGAYKAEMLAQPTPPDDQFKSIVWDDLGVWLEIPPSSTSSTIPTTP